MSYKSESERQDSHAKNARNCSNEKILPTSTSLQEQIFHKSEQQNLPKTNQKIANY